MSPAGLHLVTDGSLPMERLLSVVDAAAAAGASFIQVRAKEADARTLTDLAIAVSDTAAGRAAVLVNDRVDVALAARHAGASIEGVHLGQSDLDPVVARDLLGPEAVIGWTAHDRRHLDSLASIPAGTIDYLGVGVIHPTGSKDDAPPTLGVEGFGAFADATALPCIAIGGVRLADVPDLVSAGAAGVAVVSAVCSAADPHAATTEFVSALGAFR